MFASLSKTHLQVWDLWKKFDLLSFARTIPNQCDGSKKLEDMSQFIGFTQDLEFHTTSEEDKKIYINKLDKNYSQRLFAPLFSQHENIGNVWSLGVRNSGMKPTFLDILQICF